MGGTPTGRDDGFGKIEAFIEVLTDAIGKVEEMSPALQAHAEALEELKGSSALADLEAELESGRGQVDAAADQAEEAIDELTAKARTGAEDRLDQMDDQVEKSHASLVAAATEATEALRSAADDAASDGFDEAEEAAREAAEAVEGAGARVESAFDDLADKLKDVSEPFEGVLVRVGEKFAEAAEATEALDKALASKADAGARELTEDGNTFGSRVEGIEERCHAVYAAVQAEASAAAEKLAEAVGESVKDVHEELKTSAGDPLDDPMEALEGALEQATTELDEWVETAFLTAGNLNGFEELVDDLRASRTAAVKVADVLEGMDGA